MKPEDLFVGGLAIVIGVTCLIAAISNSDWFYRVRKIRWIERRWGRGQARLFYAVLGGIMLFLGAFIAAGK